MKKLFLLFIIVTSALISKAQLPVQSLGNTGNVVETKNTHKVDSCFVLPVRDTSFPTNQTVFKNGGLVLKSSNVNPYYYNNTAWINFHDVTKLVGTTIPSNVLASSLTSHGTITSGGLGTGAVVGGVTMTLGSDAQGDLYYRNGSGVLTRLPAGTSSQILHSGTTPSWKDTTTITSTDTSTTGLRRAFFANTPSSTVQALQQAGVSTIASFGTTKVNFGTSTGTGITNYPDAGTTIADGIAMGTGIGIFRGSGGRFEITAPNSSALILGDGGIGTRITQSNSNLVILNAGFNFVANNQALSSFTNAGWTLTPASLTGSVTTSTFASTSTLNTSGVTDVWQQNVTATAYGAGSKLLNLKVATVSKFSVDPTGAVNAVGVTSTAGFVATTSRIQGSEGAPVASTTNLTLGSDGNVFQITGTTTIDNIIATGWQSGSVVRLYFNGILTMKNNTGGGGGTKLFLFGGVDYVTADKKMITLVLTNNGWIEAAR